MRQGDIVRIKKGYENSQEELEIAYIVVESYVERLLIQPLVWKYAFAPTELVGVEMVERIEGEDEK